MTEEEKLLYMEQKRLAEEEMKKKKEDMLTQFLKVRIYVHSACSVQRFSLIPSVSTDPVAYIGGRYHQDKHSNIETLESKH